tara:strand:+ start:5027 stop:6559 length:1533 start_codon:yes stop_codon:yes gene_type:complete
MEPLIYDKSYEEIRKIINKHNNVDVVRKEEYGEVFTPFDLIVEMLEKIPEDAWRNPKNKWLDPGSGIGNFSMVVFYKLDKGLRSWEANDRKRRGHIIKNMIYMIEIGRENVVKCKKYFGKEANISNSDFIRDELKWKKEFEIDKFDMIYGNPPYNERGIKGKGRSDVGTKVLWTNFVDSGLDLLSKDGLMLLLTPNSWIELKSPLARRMLKKQIILIKNFDVVNAYKLFKKEGGSIPICYYLIRNAVPSKKTLIHDSTFDKFIEFDIKKYMMIPNKNVQLIEKVLKKNNTSLSKYYKFTPPKVKKDVTMYSSKNKKPYIYPLINYVHKEIRVSYSKEKSEVQNGRAKLLLPNYSMGYPILDRSGMYDVGGRTSYYIELPDNKIEKLRKVQSLFLTNFGLTIINSLKTGQKFMSTRTFDIFPDVSDWKKEITDDMLEKHYGLTGIEKESIKMQVDNGEGNITNNQREVILNWPQVIRVDDNELKKGNKAVSRKKVIYKVNKLKKTKKRGRA